MSAAAGAVLDREEHALLLAGLLAGLGRGAPRLAPLLPSSGSDPDLGRTCIEAGARLVLSAATTPQRVLGIHQRGPLGSGGAEDAPRDDCLRWRETRCSPEGTEHWRRVVLTHGSTDGGVRLDELLARVPARAAARARRVHALVGTAGRVYSLREPEEPAGPTHRPAWVAWQLDRGAWPALLRESGELRCAWEAAAPELEELVGRPVPPTSHGPWSLSVPLDGSGTVRIGTSRWAYAPDDEAKRRRLASLARRHGAPTFVHTLYQALVQQAAPRTRVGRAVEVEVTDGRVDHLEVYLAVPDRPAPDGPAPDRPAPDRPAPDPTRCPPASAPPSRSRRHGGDEPHEEPTP